MKTSPLDITAYFDTRAGHIKQTRGLIQALSELTPVNIKEILLPEYSFKQILYDWILFIVSFLIPSGFKSGGFKSARFEMSGKDLLSHPDLIIGTGTHTHIPMLLQKKKNAAKIVTCMMPELPLLRYIDLCFVPEHDSPPDKDNIFITQGPPNISKCAGSEIQEHDPGKGLIVVGGVDNKTHIWNNENMIKQIQAILKIQPHINWTISTSPRTPGIMIPLLETMCKNFPGTIFMPFAKTGSGWIEQEYAKSGFVWVSADSVSMVFEAISAGCRVGVMLVKWKKDTNKIALAVNLLEQNKKIVFSENFIKKPEYPAQSALNEAGRCAREILRRWWPDRLQ